MKPATLRAKLLRMHAAAEAAIVPWMDYAAWFEMHAGPAIMLRLDQCAAACEAGEPIVERGRLRAEFYPREDVLMARAWAAANPTDDPARRARTRPRVPSVHRHRR